MTNTNVTNADVITKAIAQAKAASDIYETPVVETPEEFNARMEREESEFFANFAD